MVHPELSEALYLTLLEPQSRFGDRPLNFRVVCPQHGTAVLKGLRSSIPHPKADSSEKSSRIPMNNPMAQVSKNVIFRDKIGIIPTIVG